MENAVNALRMAVGIIMGVLLLSLLVFLFRNISILENSKKDVEVAQEISEFNKKFLAFDKTLMYGTDVISVLGLAISNNKIQSQSKKLNPLGYYDSDLDYSINIEVTVPVNINNITTRSLYQSNSNGKTEKVPGKDDEGFNAGYKAILEQFGFSAPYKNPQSDTTLLLHAGTYSLVEGDAYDVLEDIAVNSGGIIEKPIIRKGIYILQREIDNYGLNDFKKTIYKCERVGKDDAGRVNYMKFVPKN